MAAEVTTTVGAALIASQIVARSFYDAAYQEAIIPPLVKNYPLTGQNSDVAKVAKMPKLTATAQTQGVDMNNSAFAPTSVSVTAALAGVMITLLDAFLSSDIIGDPRRYAAEVAKAIVEKIDTDLAAEFADAATSVGTTTADFTIAQFLTAIYELLNGKARPPFIFIGHPIQKHDIRAAIATASAAIWGGPGGGPGMVFTPGMPEMFFNVTCFETTVCASVNSDADRQGAMMPLGDDAGIVYAEKWGPRVELQRDASKIGTELVGSAYYGDECCDTSAKAIVKIVTDHE